MVKLFAWEDKMKQRVKDKREGTRFEIVIKGTATEPSPAELRAIRQSEYWDLAHSTLWYLPPRSSVIEIEELYCSSVLPLLTMLATYATFVSVHETSLPNTRID